MAALKTFFNKNRSCYFRIFLEKIPFPSFILTTYTPFGNLETSISTSLPLPKSTSLTKTSSPDMEYNFISPNPEFTVVIFNKSLVELK